MRIVLIPIFRDNYSYLIIDEATNHAAVVDPAEASVVLAAVEREDVKLTHVLTTHKHWDHTHGNEEVKKRIPDVEVVGPRAEAGQIPAITREVAMGERVSISSLNAQILETPCHTSGHIAYLIDDALFCGDTLFVGGCGRFFEGDGAQMNRALNEVFAKLPPQTRVFCGHEYTISNLEFALTVEPNNDALVAKMAWAQAQREADLPTIPSTLSEELTYNPFMRVDQPSVIKAVGMDPEHAVPGDVMQALREMKNRS